MHIIHALAETISEAYQNQYALAQSNEWSTRLLKVFLTWFRFESQILTWYIEVSNQNLR